MASLVPVKVTPLDEVGGGEHGVASRRAPLKSPRSTRSAHASGEERRWWDHRGRAKGELEGNGGGEVEEEDAAPTKLPFRAREERKTETATAGGKWGWRRRGGSWPADALSPPPPPLSFRPLLIREAVPNKPPLRPSSPVPAPWQPEFFGEGITVNGKAWPFLIVYRRRYRLRILNAINARYFNVSLSNSFPIHVFGSDASYLSALDTVTNLLSLAEIFDVIIDFS
uniref:Spore coat proein-like protein n=2 Tax=Oryza sativa subsp. japonica TaxID=39947 RepID=Q7G2F9_ORYSJ|nr:spore coat proein-like protein [Oryza sativa Japonica Group]AAP54433.1 hypothetical protein LOC_Os10g35320 [Oryza sativa Japonica Group]